MNRGKYAAPRRRRRRSTLKPLLVAMAVVLLIGCVAGGTLAWLTDTTDNVVNTFTTSDINITLRESSTSTNPDVEEHNYKMIPGCTITKDPKVTVASGSEACYVFVEVTKSTNFDTYMTYTIDSGWTKLSGVDGVDNVYYRIVDDSNEMGVAYSVLKDNQVSVKDTVTKEKMNALNEQGASLPTLTFKAYAIQYMKNSTENFTAVEAYTNVMDAATTNP